MADVTLTYKGDTIAELSESGSKTIETAGKYCEADILLEYVKSGGGSLPSCITALAGGSFTPSANTQCNAKQIQHDLTTTPKGFFIWSDDSFKESSTETTLYLLAGYFSQQTTRNPSGDVAGYYVSQYYRQSDFRISVNSGVRTSAQISSFTNDNYICLYSPNEYYQAGKTYKWLAWA